MNENNSIQMYQSATSRTCEIFQDFPNEMLVNIVSHLPHRSVLELSLLNRKWSDICYAALFSEMQIATPSQIRALMIYQLDTMKNEALAYLSDRKLDTTLDLAADIATDATTQRKTKRPNHATEWLDFLQSKPEITPNEARQAIVTFATNIQKRKGMTRKRKLKQCVPFKFYQVRSLRVSLKREDSLMRRCKDDLRTLNAMWKTWGKLSTSHRTSFSKVFPKVYDVTLSMSSLDPSNSSDPQKLQSLFYSCLEPLTPDLSELRTWTLDWEGEHTHGIHPRDTGPFRARDWETRQLILGGSEDKAHHLHLIHTRLPPDFYPKWTLEPLFSEITSYVSYSKIQRVIKPPPRGRVVQTPHWEDTMADEDYLDTAQWYQSYLATHIKSEKEWENDARMIFTVFSHPSLPSTVVVLGCDADYDREVVKKISEKLESASRGRQQRLTLEIGF